MRIVVVGASGNAGTALLRRLRRERGLDLVGVARRPPGPDAGEPYDGLAWHPCDVGAPGAAGVPGSSYSRDKADVEALLDGVEREHPGLRGRARSLRRGRARRRSGSRRP
ncbi:hypothetical protein [Micromonospora haikouensis]|uniref:hypothetical protein n=1 Tax=Micromonospora haikouensis TaxID=686309 RepID=UPI003D8BD6E7